MPQTSHKGSAKALDSPICNEAQSQQCVTSDLNQAGLLATPLRGLNIQPMGLFVACPAERARIPRPAGTTRPSAEEIERSTAALLFSFSFLVSWSGQAPAEGASLGPQWAPAPLALDKFSKDLQYTLSICDAWYTCIKDGSLYLLHTHYSYTFA